MQFKSFLGIVLLTGVAIGSTAQRVKRKGTTPIQIIKKEPAADYTLKQLEGRWQEIKRIPVGSKEPVGFTDTLLLKFNNDKVELKDATSMKMTMKGTAQIDAPNSLTVAGDVYSIKSLDKNKLVVDDGEFTRELQKKEQFYYETVGKIQIAKDSFSVPLKIDIQLLKGEWLVYSKKAEPGFINDQTALIKSLNVISVSADGTGKGVVGFYAKNISQSLPCTLIIKDGNLQIISDKYIWNYYTYKADGNEFIFGEVGKLLYFSKH